MHGKLSLLRPLMNPLTLSQLLKIIMHSAINSIPTYIQLVSLLPIQHRQHCINYCGRHQQYFHAKRAGIL